MARAARLTGDSRLTAALAAELTKVVETEVTARLADAERAWLAKYLPNGEILQRVTDPTFLRSLDAWELADLARAVNEAAAVARLLNPAAFGADNRDGVESRNPGH